MYRSAPSSRDQVLRGRNAALALRRIDPRRKLDGLVFKIPFFFFFFDFRMFSVLGAPMT